MKLLRSLWKALPGLVVLGLIGWGAFEALRSFASYLQNLDSDLAVALISAAATAIISVVVISLTKAYETRAAIRQELRAKKTPIYEEIISTLYRVFFAKILKQDGPTEKELMDFFAKTTEQLTIWGSDDLIKAYSRFRAEATPDPADPSRGLFVLEALLLEIRKDLGHSNKGLGKGSLLRLFVNDIDAHL